MSFWLFKVSEQNLYPDKHGSAYVYDNRHSVRVRRGDEFIYLDKREGKYRFTGAGVVQKVLERKANKDEKHSPSVKTVYTANLGELIWFNPPLDISPSTRQGREARIRLGLPDNVNDIGWSISMPQISKELFEVLLDEALAQENLQKNKFADSGKWRVEDNWSTVKKRMYNAQFNKDVLERHRYQCLICGTQMRTVLEAAHIRSYASDKDNRANPANGICLCKYCHAAFDAGELCLLPNGEVKFKLALTDEVAKYHFLRISSETRQSMMNGINLKFIEEKAEQVQCNWKG